jgi:hypothetical protein
MNTITIFGEQVPVSKHVLVPKKTEIILAYEKAACEGKGLAEKVLKNVK